MMPTGSSVGGEDPAADEVGRHEQQRAEGRGRQEPERAAADEAAGDLRRHEGDEADRPGRRRGHRGEGRGA